MTSLSNLGPLVLAGSGEYTPLMDIVDAYLLEVANGKPVVLIATSCAQEGADMMTKWEQMGVEHFKRLGIDAQPLRIVDSADADKSENAERIAEAGIVWFSGGSPPYLAQSFYNTRSFSALEAANRGGTAVAGASGGLGVLNDHLEFVTPVGTQAAASSYAGPNALGLGAAVRAMAHFDRAEQRRPEMVTRTLEGLKPGQTAVGVDEDTALVWTGSEWRAMGHKRVVVFDEKGERTIFLNGDRVENVPPPVRATASSRK